MRPVPEPSTEIEDELAGLRTSFPEFQISREVLGGRRRYVARRLAPGTRPHTVITPDPGELRSALARTPAITYAHARGLA